MPFLSSQKIFRCGVQIARKARPAKGKIALPFYFFARGHGVVTHLQFCVTTCSHKDMNESEKAAVPWSDVETMVKAGVGVRETARRLGLDEERIKRQVSRKGWNAMSPQSRLESAEAALATVRAEIVPNVPRAADLLAEANAENGARSRSAALRYSARGLEHLADLSPDEGVLLAAQAASLTKVAATAGEWSSASRGNVRINILAADPFAQVSIEGS